MRIAARESQNSGERWLWMVATGVIVLAAALRFFHLGTWSMWSDEVATLRDGANLRNVATYPVGYALIGLMVRFFGDSEFVARFIPALAGALTVPVLFVIGRRLFGLRAGVIAALLLAVSSFHLFYSQFARYYTLLMLFGLLGTYAAFVGMERDSRKWLGAAVALLMLAVLTHWSALLLLPALVGYVLWSCVASAPPRAWKRSDRSAGEAPGAHSPPRAANLRVPWVNILILFGPFVLAGLAGMPLVLSFLRGWEIGAGFSLAGMGLFLLKVVDRLDAAVLLCASAAVWLFWRDRDARLRWLLPFLTVPVVLAAIFTGLVGEGRAGSRFVIVALPAAILLSAWILDTLIEVSTGHLRTIAWVLLTLVVGASILKDVFYYTVEYGQRPRWREAVGYVVAHSGVTESITVTNARDVFAYYVRRLDSEGHAPIPYPSFSMVRAQEDDPGLLRSRHYMSLPPIKFAAMEMTANVKPSPKEQEILDGYELVETFPLRVRFLDYSIRVYAPPKK